MPVCNLAELRNPACKADPIGFCLARLHPNLEHAPTLCGTNQRQPYSLVLRLHRLRIFVQVRLGRRGCPRRRLFDTTLLLPECRPTGTNSVRKRLPARTALPCRLAPQLAASTSLLREGLVTFNISPYT